MRYGVAPSCAYTTKLCVTDCAALYAWLPAWLAMMVHTPAATSVTVLPLTVQTPAHNEAKPSCPSFSV